MNDKGQSHEDRAAPPAGLPENPAAFWQTRDPAVLTQPPPVNELESALRRLGPIPDASGRFPLMGFLATVYDQIAKK